MILSQGARWEEAGRKQGGEREIGNTIVQWLPKGAKYNMYVYCPGRK